MQPGWSFTLSQTSETLNEAAQQRRLSSCEQIGRHEDASKWLVVKRRIKQEAAG
jgi:hypothetical protein